MNESLMILNFSPLNRYKILSPWYWERSLLLNQSSASMKIITPFKNKEEQKNRKRDSKTDKVSPIKILPKVSLLSSLHYSPPSTSPPPIIPSPLKLFSLNTIKFPYT